jgi:hypothetical protein
MCPDGLQRSNPRDFSRSDIYFVEADKLLAGISGRAI